MLRHFSLYQSGGRETDSAIRRAVPYFLWALQALSRVWKPSPRPLAFSCAPLCPGQQKHSRGGGECAQETSATQQQQEQQRWWLLGAWRSCGGPGWSTVTFQLGPGNTLAHSFPTRPCLGITACTKAHMRLFPLAVCPDKGTYTGILKDKHKMLFL